MPEILSFCSAVLGLFMALPLMVLRQQRAANFWLGMFVLSISLLSLSGTYMYHQRPELFGLLDWPIIALGPFYYCYVRGMVGCGNSFRQIWHFVPTFCFIGFLIWMRSGVDGLGFYFNFDLFFMGWEIIATVYVLAAVYRLYQYRLLVRESYSSVNNRDLIWLSWLSVVVIAILLICVMTSLVGGPWVWFLVIGRVAVLYFVGWYGMRQIIVFLPLMPTVHTNTEPQAKIAISETPNNLSTNTQEGAEVLETNRYARSGMTEAASELIGERLVRRMTQQRDYLTMDLKLTDLAESIGTSPQLLSQYLNEKLGLSFFDYINGLRVTEVQRMLQSTASGDTPLLELALAAGFSSKSTFYTAFKKIAGKTPSQWRKDHVRMSAPIG